MKEFAYRNHLRAMPSPASPRTIERVDSTPILLKLAECGDPRKMAASYLAVIADYKEMVGDLREQLDESRERLADVATDRDYWSKRAMRAEIALMAEVRGAAT